MNKDNLKKIEEIIESFFFSEDDLNKKVITAANEAIKNGGKRLRPLIMFETYKAVVGAEYDEGIIAPFLAAIEMIHTFSLIHDDLPAMDDDDLRRGRPTNHKVFGDGMATLAGDGLLNTAFEVMNKNLLMYFDKPDELKKRINAMYCIAKAAGVGGMIAGQASDIENENTDCTNELLEYIHINKTGALITAAVRAGLYLGNADDEMVKNMTKYAECMGLAFQIADDILDVKGNPEKLGKNTGADAAKSKTTYISVNGLENSVNRLEELTDEAVEAIAPYYDNAEFFRNLVRKLASRND